MRIAEVIGVVTLNQCHPSFRGARLRLVRPLSLDELTTDRPGQADPIVAWDELGAGIGSRIAISEGSEAAQPFRPQLKPVDAYCAAILDQINLELPE
jgi:ethanolamine utilization protein EutN